MEMAETKNTAVCLSTHCHAMPMSTKWEALCLRKELWTCKGLCLSGETP